MLSVVVCLYAFVVGAVTGSFLNVCIHRLPRGFLLHRPSSHCPFCNEPIRWHDNIPVVSYLLLGRRCRFCGVRISPRYALVEALTGALFAYVAWRTACGAEADYARLGAYSGLAAALVAAGCVVGLAGLGGPYGAGAATRILAAFFRFVVLAATHCWAGWAMKLAARPGYAEGAGKLDVMWAAPKFWSFHGPMQVEAMTRSEYWASWVLAGWVYLVAAVVLAFLVTFFLSAATNIYFLLRQKVDATDLDDVYVEEEGEAEEEPSAEQAAQGPAAPTAQQQPPAEPAEPSGEGQSAEQAEAGPGQQEPPAGEQPGEEQKDQ